MKRFMICIFLKIQACNFYFRESVEFQCMSRQYFTASTQSSLASLADRPALLQRVRPGSWSQNLAAVRPLGWSVQSGACPTPLARTIWPNKYQKHGVRDTCSALHVRRYTLTLYLRSTYTLLNAPSHHI